MWRPSSNIGLTFTILLTWFSLCVARDLLNVTACPDQAINLGCPANEVIAIHEAIFYDSDDFFNESWFDDSTTLNPNRPSFNTSDDEKRRFSVQSAVNRRCSGINNCSFTLDRDEPQAKSWGIGKVRVQYGCFPAKSHSCGGQLYISSDWNPDGDDPTGLAGRESWLPGPSVVAGWSYLRSTGYPEYYRGPQECRWTLRATGGRRVRLVLLDLSIRSVLPGESSCKDVLTVTEQSRLLLSKCGDIEEPVTVDSIENELNVTLSIKSNFQARRGLLAYFSGLGCPLPEAPRQSYLVYGDTSRAQFMCCADHVFPDTALRTRNLTCLDGQRWSQTHLPDCVAIRQVLDSGNQSLIDMLRQEGLLESLQSQLRSYDLTYDIILPSAIICGLILGNLVIILIVYLRRRRFQAETGADGEENVPLQNPTTENPPTSGKGSETPV